MRRDCLKLSESGKDLVNQAARKKGWGHQAPAWASAAYTRVSTLKRFWTGKAIDRGTFIALCEAVEVDWKRVVDEYEIAPKQLNQRYSDSFRVLENSSTVQSPLPQLAYENLANRPLILDFPFYIERPPIESECYNKILQPGSLIRIKAPQQMGKTMLMEKIMESVASQRYRTVILSLKLADKTHFTNLDKFLRWFCTNVSRELGLSSQIDNFWEEEDTGSKISCTTYFEDYLLKQSDSPLVLGLDDVDLVFPHPEVYEDFFAMLRYWHEKAKTRPLWKRLRLVVVHSTEVYIPLNIDQSPFNVGMLIELSEFSGEQVKNLAKQYGLDWDANQVEQLMMMLGGNPYLVQQALSYLTSRQEIKLEEFLANAPTEAGIYSHYLRQHLSIFKQHPELAIGMRKVVTATAGVRLESISTYKLQSMGLVKLQGNEVEPRCNLYRQYFQVRLEDIL